jgi:hypothetical protein
MRRLALPAALAATLALALPATAAAPKPGVWKGSVKHPEALTGAKLAFRVSRGYVRRWRAVEVAVVCVSGSQISFDNRTIFVRVTRVRRGRIRKRVNVSGGRIILTGRFTTRTRARGTIDYLVGDCGARIRWTARRVR